VCNCDEFAVAASQPGILPPPIQSPQLDPAELNKAAGEALEAARQRLHSGRDLETAAQLLGAVAAVAAALRDAQLADLKAELLAVRQALRVREGTGTVEAATQAYLANKSLRERLAAAKREPT
jgi:hypothetical protein